MNTNQASLAKVAAEKTGALQVDDTVQTAGQRMRSLDADTLPVADDRKLVGEVRERDPDVKLISKGHDPKTWRVGEIMDRTAHFCYEDQGCDAAQQLMNEMGLDLLPVVDRELRIVSILNRNDMPGERDTGCQT